jgi:hypothetical protein
MVAVTAARANRLTLAVIDGIAMPKSKNEKTPIIAHTIGGFYSPTPAAL